MPRATRRLGRALLIASLATGACNARTEPMSAPARPAGAGGPGHTLYATYCQACHGAGGRGDGPAAPSLRARPLDLTQLWKRYGTPLDRERIARYIDGRELLSHGSREMPIWGEEFFRGMPTNDPSPESAKRRLIEVIVEYLETLQTKRQT